MKEILDAIIAQIMRETRKLIDTKTKTNEQILVNSPRRSGESLPKIP